MFPTSFKKNEVYILIRDRLTNVSTFTIALAFAENVCFANCQALNHLTTRAGATREDNMTPFWVEASILGRGDHPGNLFPRDQRGTDACSSSPQCFHFRYHYPLMYSAYKPWSYRWHMQQKPGVYVCVSVNHPPYWSCCYCCCCCFGERAAKRNKVGLFAPEAFSLIWMMM